MNVAWWIIFRYQELKIAYLTKQVIVFHKTAKFVTLLPIIDHVKQAATFPLFNITFPCRLVKVIPSLKIY